MQDGTRESMRLLALASTMGISMVLATFIGLGVGLFLDHKVFHTAPWFTIIFLILGIIAGFKNLYVIAKKVDEKAKPDNKK